MGMKNLMCEILADKQKEYIKSLSEQLKHKNELVIKESRRANEMFKLSYNRKLKIEEQQAEINRLREEKSEIEIELKNTEQTCYGWQRLVESLEDQNNQLKAGNDKLREAINSALNFMACPDDLSELTGKCNDQAAFDVLREALNNESEG